MIGRGFSRALLAAVAVLIVVAAACSTSNDDSGDGDSADGEGAGEQPFDPAKALAASSEAGDADPSCEGTSDGELKLASLLPTSGDLAVFGPATRAAANVAVAEVNDAGGVNGKPVVYREGDEGQADVDSLVQSQLSDGADVIVGAASTAVSEQVMEPVIQACRVMFSPANTAPALSLADDDDLYFRTAPSDILQGRVLADLALEEGVTSAAIISREGSYGQGLTTFTRQPFEAGGGEVVVSETYADDAGEFSNLVDDVVNADPQGLFVIGLEESATIVDQLRTAGFATPDKHIYFVDGNTTNGIGASTPTAGAMEGIRGTFPSAVSAPEFAARLTKQDPAVVDVVYGAETYDAVIVTALAATAAGSDRPDEIARHINRVTRNDGEGDKACTAFAECRDLLAKGTEINYEGASGPLEFSRPGEPTKTTLAVLSFGADNQIDPNATVYRTAAIGDP